MVLILIGNLELGAHAWRKRVFSEKNVQFVSYFDQIDNILLLMFTPIFELPSNMSPIIHPCASLFVTLVYQKFLVEIMNKNNI